MDKIYQVVVTGIRGERLAIDIGNAEAWNIMTVLKLKEKIIEKLPTVKGLDMQSLQLTYTSKTLEDSRRLTYYGIQDKSMIQSVVQLPGGRRAYKWAEKKHVHYIH